MEYASKIADRALEFVLDVSIRHVSYIICYKGNVKELNERIEDLELANVRVKHEVDYAEKNVKGVEDDVGAWLEKVGEKMNEYKGFLNDEEHAKTGCSRGIFPFLWYRHKLGRRAKKMALDVNLLIEKSHFGSISFRQNLRSVDASLYNAAYVEFRSRKITVENIMAKLEDSTVRMIGVYGSGGVGKSTLVQQIAKKARENKLFNVVVIVNVTADPNLQKIQEKIADDLELTFEGEGESGRADRLRRRLKQEKDYTLVILDDLWDGLDLNKIGIPFDDDHDDLSHAMVQDKKMVRIEKYASDYGGNKSGTPIDAADECLPKDFSYKMGKSETSPGAYKGCKFKVLLTSRIKGVLSDKMNVGESSIFRVNKLTAEESETLFNMVAEIPDGHSKFKLEIVLKYCEGLPMAILTVGRALRKKSELVWEEAIEKLKRQELMGPQKYMEFSVQMSYDHLESGELKSIFLLSAQMGHHPLIMDLVKYSFSLGILKGVHTLWDARESIHKSIQKLKDSGLMLDSNSSVHFKMHDMVRDAALSISHKDQNVFTLRNEKLNDWPDEDELEKCTTISIYKSDIVDELPEVINCPQLRVFHIDSDGQSLNIHDEFFKGMKKLRVLILIGIHLPRLPSSIKCLSNLRMLCLERCVLDDLSGIGNLKKLRIFSLSGSKVRNLTDELGGLIKLQLLDISDCSIAEVIPPNIISNLTSLEELYMRKSLTTMEVEGEANRSQIAVLSELKHLHQLKVIDMCIQSASIFPLNLLFDKLNDYKIVIGDWKMSSIGDFKMPNKYEASRSLVLQLKAGTTTNIHSLKGVKMMFKSVKNLLLGELNGVQNAFYELNLDGFPDLKHLSIIKNLDLEYIINSMDLSHPVEAFPDLEFLSLYKLTKLKEICCSPITNASFSRLKTIKVMMCTQLKKLFSFYIVKFLSSLETIDVSECDSLEGVVVEEREVNTEKVEFPKLCSLTLQHLPLFTIFYTKKNVLSIPQLSGPQARHRDHIEITTAEDEHMVTSPLSLFGEQVEIKNLESLKLSSINIHKIWSDQSLSSFSFQNLIKLTVTNCHNLRSLCSLSVASKLEKLKGLFVSECRMMKNIFIIENNMDYSKVRVFPKLEEIHLTNMKMLEDIWLVQVREDSFTSLISVHIEGCKKLVKVFPCHMEGWFQSLNSLKVADCKSVEVIFEIRNSAKISAPGAHTKLQLILLNNLPNLKQVWNRDPGGIVNFKSLRSINIDHCPELRNVLPVSVAKGLQKLEEFSVRSCYKMEEIVAFNEKSDTSNEPLEFYEVTSMEFKNMLNLRCFYIGGLTVTCPKLNRLMVNNCPMLKTFPTEGTNDEDISVFSADKVIPHLESIELCPKEAKWLARNLGKYRMHHLKQLRLHSLRSIDILYRFLYRIPHLQRLELIGTDCHAIKELVPRGHLVATEERLGTVLQLKELALIYSFIEDIGFERDPVLQQRLERLVMNDCMMLINFAHPSVSFTHLTYLEVNNCSSLRNFIASSTAASLAQLTTMKVIHCGQMTKIVTSEGNEEDREVNIVFGKLITIVLVGLQNLSSFCSYKNCNFSFPSLEKLIVRSCPKLKTFTESHTTAPKLQNVLVVEGEEEEEKWYWEGDLNATIKKVFADQLSYEYTHVTHRLELSTYPELIEQVWKGKDLVQEYSFFRYLNTLVVSDCDNLVHVIPSHLLPCFKNLEKLEVRYCKTVQVIFNINDHRMTESLGILMFSLKRLSLYNLPKLGHVWDKDPEGILDLQVLQDISVYQCNSLKYLFPTSMAKDLANKLKKLSIINCEELVEIFADDGNETTSEGACASRLFKFPCLTSLKLRMLPMLKYIYPRPHAVEWPVLKKVYVDECPWELLKCQDAYPEEQILIPIVKIKVLIPSLEKLSFVMRDTTVLWDVKSHKLVFQNLPSLQEELDGVLFGCLQMVPHIEKVEVEKSSSEKLFSAERPKAGGYSEFLTHLKGLRLFAMLRVQSIGLEHSWLRHITENLHTLEVNWCCDIKNLVPCTVSFSNLTSLIVFTCDKLLYLFTSSTVKSLARLKRMEIRKCRSMQEIVSKEDEGSHDEDQNMIILEQLEILHLQDLPKLRCFYSGNFTVSFPSLKQVYLIDCLWMETFCPYIIINPNSIKLLSEVGSMKYATPLESDLNITMRKMNEKKMAEISRDLEHLGLTNDPCFQNFWYRSVPIPHACFSNLKSLIIDGCDFLSEALPFHLLPFFSQIERMQVRNCGSVKTIFDVKFKTEDNELLTLGASLPSSFPLKKLLLCNLPNLVSVWNDDPDGVLMVKSLEEVRVDKCKCLTNLFPTSVAKDLGKLETIELKHCEGLVEIVAGTDEAPKGTNLEFKFPSLNSLTLLDLPKLELKIFTCQALHIEDQVCIEKVTPNLNLSLGEKELKMIWQGQCQGNLLPRVKVLHLLEFDTEPHVFPYGFLQKIPNIEDLVVSESSLKEIFCSERPNVDYTGSLLQLKGLKLDNLSEFISIGSEHSSFLKNLETLEATNCSRLKNLVPSFICFSNLVRLNVTYCHDMIHLFTTSTAASLGKLKHMDISHCKSIQEIVSNEGDESQHDDIIFGQLQTLKLKDLPNLKRFYKGSITLSFPSLEQLSLISCGRMDTFCPGTITANKLSAVRFRKYEATPLNIDLNFTIQKKFEAEVAEFFRKVKQLKLVDHPEVHEIWRGSFPVPFRCFNNLKSLIVERCEVLSTVISFHILCLLCKLEELEVRQCHSVKAIFEVKDTKYGKKMNVPFKKMTFEKLPNLKKVWESNPHEVMSFQSLQQVCVNGCDNLESLFPPLVAQSLVKLEKLDVQQCGELVEIVSHDEASTDGEPKEFIFACMTSMTLQFLPALKCFYPGLHKLEFPKLKQIHLFHCDKMKTFTFEFESFPEAQPEYQSDTSFYPHALFSAEKVVPNLEFLALSKEEIMMIWHGQFPVNLLHNLQALQLQCFHSVSDNFPYGLFLKAPNIEKLCVSCSSFKNIFCSKDPSTDLTKEILLHLKCLQLSSLSVLNSIGLEHSWIGPISENLEKLQIDECHSLRNIVPSKVSFTSLVDLKVSQCHGLVYLFTPSTARSLSQLKNMSVENCESLQEIVLEEVDESSYHDTDRIIFKHLDTLTLRSLPKLARFCKGSLSFPYLQQLLVIDCRRMETFCLGTVNANKWATVKFKEDEDEDEILLKVDLNSAILRVFETTVDSKPSNAVKKT